MKPDGVVTTPAEPADDVVEPVPEEADSEDQVQQDSCPSQPVMPENKGEQEGTNSTLPPPGKEVDGKFSKLKDKTRAPVKSKPGTAGTKARTTSNAASRPATSQSRVANGVMKTTLNGASKKPSSMTSEFKKCAPVAASAQAKKVPTATTVAPKTEVKAADRKSVMASRPVSSTSSAMRRTVASASALGTKPVTGGSNAAVKPKTTASRPTTSPAAKASVSAASKASPIPKTTRATVATVSRPTTSSAQLRPTSTASKALRTAVSAPSQTKDIKTTTSAAAKKPLASTTRSTATKASKPEPPKTGTAARRLPMDTKTSQPKMNETRQVSTRKVPQSRGNISSQLSSGKMATGLSNHKQGTSNNLVSMKNETTKPKQTILPLVVKEQTLEQQSECLESSEISVTATTPVESVTEVHTLSVAPTFQLLVSQREDLNVPVSEPTSMGTISTKEPKDAEPIDIQHVANVHVMSKPPTVIPEAEVVHDNVFDMAQEMMEQKPIPTLSYEVQVTTKDLEVSEKQDQIVCNLEEEEEEREGSQQVSVSDMSGTQPTEESRPGSAGLAGSLWRAGGLPSEFDSEDVSCSQQGASELSAPGVLEGTESMDDLGEASLKGADGDGASAGSPDFEKFPDIPVNEDEEDDEEEDDDDDHVDYMEVGSEMTEDPQRQCNDNEDEDEDVEMASEGVTESGLESYGNADEDDLAEDYRLDNLNRMQHSSIVFNALSAANPFADACLQSLQSGPSLVSSSSSNPEQIYSEFSSQPVAHACLDIGTVETEDPVQSSTLPSSEPAVKMDQVLKQGFASYSQCIPQSSTLLGPDLVIHTCSNASTQEELKDYSISPELENQKRLLPVSSIPVALPEIIVDLGSGRFDHTGYEHEDEEPETLPADDMLAGLSAVTTSAPSSHSSATGDEVSDTEGDMQISDPTEPGSTGNECFDGVQVVHGMSELVEQCEQTCVEVEGGGGGSDTPQSATSAASYGFECTTSNSNAQSTTESCVKSPGIFSLENEEQFLDEAKDPAFKELNLAPAGIPTDTDLLDKQAELQLNSEQQFVLCGQATEETAEPCSVEGTVPVEKGLDICSSSEQQRDLDLGTPHPYYSTCEKTDSLLTGVTTVHTRTPKHHSVLRVDHVMRVPTALPPKMPIGGCNAQLRRLKLHQQQLEEIEQRQHQQSRSVERQSLECEGEKNQKGVLEQNEEAEFKEQRQDLLHQQNQEQQQEEFHRHQIMQWQQELEHHEQDQHQNSHQKNLTTVLLSPSGLCTIYEALETSDAEEDTADQMKGREMVLKIKVEHEYSPKKRSSNPETGFSLDHSTDSPQSHCTSPSHVILEHKHLTSSVTADSPTLSGSNLPQQSFPLERDWSKKADIVQQLINQTLLLSGDNCSPQMLLPGRTAGTLSPLETSLWPNLPPLAPPSATVTSVSSFSAETSGNSPQGEWTVVELETHH